MLKICPYAYRVWRELNNQLFTMLASSIEIPVPGVQYSIQFCADIPGKVLEWGPSTEILPGKHEDGFLLGFMLARFGSCGWPVGK